MSIAFDSHGSISDNPSTSSLTWAHVVAGSNKILVVMIWARTSEHVPTGVTYNGVAMTFITSQVSYLGNDTAYIYYLVNPDSGTHNVVASFSASGYCGGQSVSYTGASQTGQPDNYASDAGGSGQDSFSLTLTTILDNCWLIATYRGIDGVYSAGANTVIRGTDDLASADSGGDQTPAGSHSLNFTGGGSRVVSRIIISIAPALAGLAVETDVVSDILDVSAVGNGDITDVSSGDADERGFVWGTTPQSDPGDVAPASSGYDDYETESGTFGTGAYTGALASLTPSTTYYVRAYVHNGDGYVYGDEVTFDTLATPPFRFTNIGGVVFDPDDTQTIFAERLNDILERLEALE